jgi:hypothetical protein
VLPDKTGLPKTLPVSRVTLASADYRVIERENEFVFAATVPAFQARFAGERQRNIERAGGAVRLSRNCAR